MGVGIPVLSFVSWKRHVWPVRRSEEIYFKAELCRRFPESSGEQPK